MNKLIAMIAGFLGPQNRPTGAPIWSKRLTRLAWGGVSAGAIAFAVRLAQGDAPPTPTQSSDIDAAVTSIVQAISTNSGCPKSAEGIRAAAAAAFPIMSPALFTRDQLNDPEVVRAQAAARDFMLNTKAIAAEQMKDPEVVRRANESLAAMTNSIVRPVHRGPYKFRHPDGSTTN